MPYYNGVASSRTTRCCSAVALILCSAIGVNAAKPSPPMSLMPTRQVWTLALNLLITLPPAYDESRVYLPIEGDRIAAYDFADGSLQWVVNAKPMSAPAAGGGFLYLVEADAIRALHAKDGTVAWKIEFSEPLVARLVWDNGWLVAATKSGSIVTYRATDGQQIWRHDLGSPAHAAPALAADHIYISTSDKRVVALDVTTGEPRWERRVGGAPNDILALDDRMYVGAEDDFLYCLMTKDGRVDWRWRTGGDVIGMPVADAQRVYFVALDNVVRALDRVSGGQRWLRSLTLRPTWGPVIAGGTIIVGGQASSLRAFNLTDGVAAGETPAGAEVMAPPYAASDPLTRVPMVLILTRDIAKGGALTLVERNIEPAISPMGPLPNPIMLAPTPPAVK